MALLSATSAVAGETFDVGRPAQPIDIAGWDIDVTPDGRGLPIGQGSVEEGAQVYSTKCAACHGLHGEGKPMDPLVGGTGSIDTAHPVKSVGSFWPYATTLYDYVHRAMPFNAPQTLSAHETYAVTAYVLHLNGLVPDHTVLDAKSLPHVKMPSCSRFHASPLLQHSLVSAC